MDASIVTALLDPIPVNLVASTVANVGELGVQLMKVYRV